MKIEILYPELCTLYGDKGNMQYLKLCRICRDNIECEASVFDRGY